MGSFIVLETQQKSGTLLSDPQGGDKADRGGSVLGEIRVHFKDSGQNFWTLRLGCLSKTGQTSLVHCSERNELRGWLIHRSTMKSAIDKLFFFSLLNHFRISSKFACDFQVWDQFQV